LVLAASAAILTLRQPAANRPAAEPIAPVEAALPPAAMERFLAARGLWADRSAASLAQARAELDALTRAYPRFAPAWAALAETWLLSREFAALPDEQAFAEAERAARRAVALDPGNAAGHRALGFLAYWWRNDPVMAGKAMRRALELAPGDAQTHFWYGNVLSDNGQHAAALRHLNRARTLDPGNVALKVDHAWALWQAGETAQAERLYAELRATAPDHVVLRNSLADIAMIGRDWPRFLAEYEAYARLREDRALPGQAGGSPRCARC
ncbi:MAG TPA: tetratricopeptide repeat protein, partial [Novosphingobium sp.]|nr:tetratricopeptide repeat protein [Novosphingobium sp.]